MKYSVEFSCGHTEEVQIYGKAEERERKIRYFGKSGLCHECYKKKMNEENAENCEEVVMSYREYKENYADCKTKAGSYDKTEKTIVVYVPKKEEKEEKEEDAKEICQKALEAIVKSKNKTAEEVTPADVYDELVEKGYDIRRLKDMPDNIRNDIIERKEYWS